MVESFLTILRVHPEIALFLTLGAGYVIGKIRVAGHDLGLVTGSLFAGLAIGQIGVEVAPEIKTIFLLMFLFANGYGAGPQFFQALRGDGIKPLILTAVICLSGLGMVWLMGTIMGLGPGYTAGLLSGSLTQSAAIGTATEAIMALPRPLAERQALVNQIPIADAVCYLFGFWGEVFYVAALMPRMIGLDLEKAAREMEGRMGLKQETGAHSAYVPHAVRGFRLRDGLPWPDAAGLEAAALARGSRVFVLRVRDANGRIEPADGATRLHAGDTIALAGQRGVLASFGAELGTEADDAELLDIPMERIDCLVSNSAAIGPTLGELAVSHGGVRGIFVPRIMRGGQEMPVNMSLRLDRGDVVTLMGQPDLVESAGRFLGFPMRATNVTDMFTLCIGIAVGCLIGLPALYIGTVKLSLSTAVGTLLAGLLAGWLRSWKPNVVGAIPEASVSFMISFGLAGFVAITGLHAGPAFIPALKEMGVALLIAGAVCTCVPPTIGLFLGHYVLRMNPVLLLGAISGAQTMTAAMVAVQERAKSRIPVLGFTVPYAVGNIILTTWGTVIVLLMTL